MINAVLYLLKFGSQWRIIPHDFPPYKTMWSFYKRACDKEIWDEILKALVSVDRLTQGKNNDLATDGLIDSQSVKTTYRSEDKGIDSGKSKR